MSVEFLKKINLENEQEPYFMILLKSQFGQMSQIGDNGPLRVNALNNMTLNILVLFSNNLTLMLFNSLQPIRNI